MSRCDPPVHRFPMKQRKCYCEEIDTPLARWGKVALTSGTKITTGIVGRPGQPIKDGSELNKSQIEWGKSSS